jgi:ParB family chromosome partitioning protein
MRQDGSLIPQDGALSTAGEDALGVVRSIPVEAIEPNRYQPRSRFDDDGLAALADSIRELGVLQPVLVRPAGHDRFELIAGERRWRAARRAGMRMIPALVRGVEDLASLEQAIVENLHRQDLSALEEATAYQQLVDDFAMTQEQIARRVGKSRSAVSNMLRLLQLPPSVQRLVADGSLSAGHARALLTVVDPVAQLEIADRIVQADLSVRQVERLVRRLATGAADDSPGAGSGSGTGEPEAGAGYLEVTRLLEERLATKVEVAPSGSGGRLVIRFADPEDLRRIFDLLA